MTTIIDTFNIHQSWHALFVEYNTFLTNKLKIIHESTDIIYPSEDKIFKIFEMDINKIKIVLLGQDPYIKPGQAMGLSFSAPKTLPIPDSLKNIFKEINNEFPERNYIFTHGDLSKWTDQGIFLLNSELTVIKGKSNSQEGLWSEFTDAVIKYINDKCDNIVFLLLGKPASKKQKFIDDDKNTIVIGVHPSPLSAYKGFFNSNIFKRVENELKSVIDWNNN